MGLKQLQNIEIKYTAPSYSELLLQKSSCHVWIPESASDKGLINKLKLCRGMNSFTRVVKTCKTPLRHLISNKWLCGFNHKSTKSLKFTCKENGF